MKEAVRKAVQKRYEENSGVPVVETATSKPWQPRTDGLRAILVNQRATVFDRPAEIEAVVANPVADITDPIWDHHGGRVWTPDLVHCRLLNVGDTITRLPSPMRRGFVSLLGDAALADRDRAVRLPPSAAEISIADWTWSELLKRPGTQRAILQAMAFGLSVRKVAQMLQKRQAAALGKSSIATLYLSERRNLAAMWQAGHQLVDTETWERWRVLFQKAEN